MLVITADSGIAVSHRIQKQGLSLSHSIWAHFSRREDWRDVPFFCFFSRVVENSKLCCETITFWLLEIIKPNSHREKVGQDTITVDPVAIAAPCWLFTLMLYPQHNIPLFRIIVIVTVTTANITQWSETEDNLDQSFIVHRSRFFRSRMNFYMNLARSHEHKKKKTQRQWAASLGQRRISLFCFLKK